MRWAAEFSDKARQLTTDFKNFTECTRRDTKSVVKLKIHEIEEL